MTTKAEYEAQVSGLHAQADAYARYFGFKGATDGVWDAFRHAYVSAEMARVHGTLTASSWAICTRSKASFKVSP